MTASAKLRGMKDVFASLGIKVNDKNMKLCSGAFGEYVTACKNLK